MVLSKLKAELSSFYARGNSSYIRLIPTYFTSFWSCFKHLQVNKNMKIVLRILNISSTWILPNHHHLHLWNCSHFSISDIKVDFYGYWKMVNKRNFSYSLLISAFIWVEHVFISSVHQNFYHIYILHRASISVSCFASPVSENSLSYVFFFQCPYPSSDSCLSITFSCRYIEFLNKQVYVFFFFQEMCLYECYLSSSVKLIYSTVTSPQRDHAIIS